ncbi:hypothetical protein M3O96_12570 [Aquiflexum sp. TKW24L]|uniref:hypothetical protein n=1 Tax=Aquiflexum sp. TKW24L TaxID=2942212 RepID=UPI0020C0036C|nr:hypothetical protein [Aquiflexum sp. TKW24L]MCL6259930.1 hypothetical protein [Aquiflexum sp. TKW24L]
MTHMLQPDESRIKAIVYDFAPSNTVKILDMLNHLPFVENLGTVYSQDSMEEKIINQEANLVFVNICYKMSSVKFSPDQVIERVKTLNPHATIVLCKSNIGPLLRQLYLHQGFDFVVDKVKHFDKIPLLLKEILLQRESEVAVMVA